jgi:hypothetical protein
MEKSTIRVRPIPIPILMANRYLDSFFYSSLFFSVIVKNCIHFLRLFILYLNGVSLGWAKNTCILGSFYSIDRTMSTSINLGMLRSPSQYVG